MFKVLGQFFEIVYLLASQLLFLGQLQVRLVALLHFLDDLLCFAIGHQVKPVLLLLLFAVICVTDGLRGFFGGLDTFSFFLVIAFFFCLGDLCLACRVYAPSGSFSSGTASPP